MAQIWIFTVFLIGFWRGVSEASVCTARGRFPNDNVADCKGYTMCLSGAPGVYTQYDLSCPDTFIYSHIDNQCTNITSYQCYPQYNCSSLGDFRNENDLNCTTYIACIHGLNEIATARLVECPEGTLFSSLNGTCVNSTQVVCISDDKPPIILDPLPSQESKPKSNNAINLCSQYVLLIILLIIKM
ncbi:uncharacterized protein [Choristoneura fumiferana]|uniref:uncharacterized protein n=1 Tax=Choristoneura fumiferana TaxID=7141 RepID=UPI003D1574E3